VLIAAILLLNLLATVSCFDGQSEVARPSNLILISIDTLRADHVGAYGYPRPTTPNIDALARDAVLFKTCVAHAPTTLASHASIFTSLLPRHHGASISRMTRLAEGVPTLAEALLRRGYHTASFNGGVQLDRVYGMDRGFDVYESVKPRQAGDSALGGDENRLIHGVERSLEWIGKVEQPFFLFLHSYEIHHPYTPDEQTLELFEKSYTGRFPSHISKRLLSRINAGAIAADVTDLQHIIDTYDAELRSADEAVGKLIASLRQNGLYEDAMIILTSDHGEEFTEHGIVGWHAHTLYDELLLVPLIIKFPKSLFAGRVVDSQVRGIDVAPTALEALGIEIPQSFTGSALGANMANGTEQELLALSMFDSGARNPQWSLRSERWKLHSWAEKGLVDLIRDPSEARVVAGQFPRRTKLLRARAMQILDAREKPKDVAVAPRHETLRQLKALGYLE